jgi:hypothetical protein
MRRARLGVGYGIRPNIKLWNRGNGGSNREKTEKGKKKMALAQYKQKLLDEFESRTDEWKFFDFEARLSEVKNGASYQDAKMLIKEAHKLGEWPKTVRIYLETLKDNFGDLPIELLKEGKEVLGGK